MEKADADISFTLITCKQVNCFLFLTYLYIIILLMLLSSDMNAFVSSFVK